MSHSRENFNSAARLLLPSARGQWVELVLSFLEMNRQNSGLPESLFNKLQALHTSERIVFRNLKNGWLGGYNHLTGKLTLNSLLCPHLQYDYPRRIEAVERTEPETSLKLKRLFAHGLIDWSGIFVHEGRHALKFHWSRRKDETVAFGTEQAWYAHLHSLESPYREYIYQVAKQTESDSSTSPVYRKLRLQVPCLIRPRP